MLARRGQARARPAALVGAWAGLLAAAVAVTGRTGLGTLLTAAFALQVTPSIWTAYRTAHPTGISQGTWLLILGELSCWGDLRPAPVRSASGRPRLHRDGYKPAHARPNPPHHRNPTVNSTGARHLIQTRLPQPDARSRRQLVAAGPVHDAATPTRTIIARASRFIPALSYPQAIAWSRPHQWTRTGATRVRAQPQARP
jgi:hypothetical protein